uniref:Selenoprotein O n=1 Tax=Sinocyclocheilus grahami TaxID=75366 RepID=A0A672RIH9_SINGR
MCPVSFCWSGSLKGGGQKAFISLYCRQSDGRKVLCSSIREFLCSEAMFALGIPTTQAGSLVTSDLYVQSNAFYSGNPRPERCFVVLRIALIRLTAMDRPIARAASLVARRERSAVLLSSVILSEFISSPSSSSLSRSAWYDCNTVTVRTAKLVGLWQSVGFCHGVLNTDNMSILGLTIVYDPFGFMDRSDPEFPDVCRWNLARLAEALGAELQSAKAGAILDEFMTIYQDFYLDNLRRKLGLLRHQEPEDVELVADLLKTMHITGVDFTNTYRLLSAMSCPAGEQKDSTDLVVELIVEQCASLEELKVANNPTMQPSELERILSMAETNPGASSRSNRCAPFCYGFRFERHVSWKRCLLMINETFDISGHHIRRRLARECNEASDPAEVEKQRVKFMNSTNPTAVLRNYIAQNAIEAAERGDFSEVRGLD